MKKVFLTVACALTVSAAQADTIRVERAQATPPMTVRMPYMTDSTAMDGSVFDINKVLDSNTPVVLNKAAYGADVRHGDALFPADGAAHALVAVRFHVDADRFTKAAIEVKKLRHYKTYLNGAVHSGNELQLMPGRTDIALLALVDSTKADSFLVSLTGQSLAGLEVNSAAKRVYSMDDMRLGDHCRSVSVSPSGTYLVAVYYDMKAGGSAVYRTVVSDLTKGKDIMRLNNYADLRWLPARDVLYFTRQGNKGRELVLFDPRDGHETLLTDNLPEGGFTLSPSEDYAIMQSTLPSKTEFSNGLKRLEAPDDRMPGWRHRTALSRYDFKTGLLVPLTYGSSSVWVNDISADGRRLLLSYSRQNPSKAPFDRTTLVEMDAYSGRVDTLLADTTFLASACYSPEADKVLIKASPASFGGLGSEVKAGQIPNAFDYRLYLYDKKSGTTTPLLRNFKPSVGDFFWSKGDGNIYFRASDGSDESLFRLVPSTGRTLRYALPVTYVQGFSIAKGMKQPRAVFFGQTGVRAREMFTCRLGNEAAPKTGRIGEIDFDRAMDGVRIGDCRDWRFRSSRGDTISGFYFLPPDFDASKKYPVIVYYYGGCTPTPKMLEFSYAHQVLAGQGYVVYVVQPSGAIGFGQEFAARHVGTWGQESADDIIEGTRAFLAAHPWADAARVGCIGASYGGFMTEYLQTRTDIFAAAISHAGISNIASYWGGGYWGYTYGEAAQYGSYPWNNPDMYVKQSPLFNADKIHTPLLLLHGTVDTNVPTTESQQLFTALRILGRPVSYVQVDNENHVISDYKKREAWQNVIFAWFAKWLKDEPLWWKTLYPDDKFGLQ